MGLSFLSMVGCLLIVGGLLLPIYTANLLPLSKKSQRTISRDDGERRAWMDN